MPRKAVILSNGKIHDPDVIHARLNGWEDALVIGADAGSRHAAVLGLTLTLMIGDFDSLDADTRTVLESQGVEVRAAPPQKDETDLELALLAAVEAGADHIVILGASGGRLDMTIASILLLSHPALAQTHTEIWVDQQTTWVIDPPGGDIYGQRGDTVSLIPIGGDVLGVSANSLAYPLNNEPLIFGPARGVSNVMESDTAYVALHSGLLLVIHTPGRA
jgi:thiamine pyrophosphokinase